MNNRLLLPDLPPELRNIIYSHTISPSNPASNFGLPFQAKIYDSSHTKVVIIPVYHGNPKLFALLKYRFQEAKEYHSWLLTNAIGLRISVFFKGREETFVQDHWDEKMTKSIKKLRRKYPWFGRVMEYDVRIIWAPNALVHSRRRKNIGGIARRMVEVLTQEMGVDLKAKRGIVKAGLHIGDWVADEYARQDQPIGLQSFLSIDKKNPSLRTQIREVWIAPADYNGSEETKANEKDLPIGFKPVLKYCKDEVLRAEKGIIEWGVWTKGAKIFQREVTMEKEGVVDKQWDLSWMVEPNIRRLQVHQAIVKECSQTTEK